MWTEVEELLSEWPLCANRRSEINGSGIVMGAVIPGGAKQIAIHSASFDYAASIRRLISLLRRLSIIDDHFPFSSIQLLVRAAVLPHSDPNPTDSIIFMCGDYSGGLFKVLDESFDLWRKPLRFDGGCGALRRKFHRQQDVRCHILA